MIAAYLTNALAAIVVPVLVLAGTAVSALVLLGPLVATHGRPAGSPDVAQLEARAPELLAVAGIVSALCVAYAPDATPEPTSDASRTTDGNIAGRRP